MEKCCGTCKHHRYESEYKDWLCTNDDSDNYADWTPYEHTCEEWEER